MTRKDFELIANVLKDSKAPKVVREKMADALRGTNPNFNREKFLEACTVKGN